MNGSMLSVDPAYENYVTSNGLDGATAWHVDDNYSCGNTPCSAGWDFPSDLYLPTPLPFNTNALTPVPGTVPDPDSIFLQFP
eukprot:CAMPEP_0173418056 /NCGR_PEP_ID=MMETSP1357-20121228/288_1 /TAXON_ID=77926 /ORGANISM="Hemiselmis rufescens, Strain PCC563" /LENGTH=81 /DNA_ID=CAMNT_0014380473 /DNA_START=59 /DNA_END=304 /DNA_ORIENTATION=-